MTAITFIYKIGKNSKVYYGKCKFSYLSDDHNGLDKEVKPYVLEGINRYRKQKNIKQLKSKFVKIGILSNSCFNDFYCYVSEKEIECFDFYCICNYYYKRELYMNGKKL